MPEADCADSIFDSLPQGSIKKPGRPQQNFSASLCAEKQLVSTHQTVIKVTPLLLNALHSLHCWQEGLLCSCVFSKKKNPNQNKEHTTQNKIKQKDTKSFGQPSVGAQAMGTVQIPTPGCILQVCPVTHLSMEEFSGKTDCTRLLLQLQLIASFLYYCYRINTNIAPIFRLIKGSSTSL